MPYAIFDLAGLTVCVIIFVCWNISGCDVTFSNSVDIIPHVYFRWFVNSKRLLFANFCICSFNFLCVFAHYYSDSVISDEGILEWSRKFCNTFTVDFALNCPIEICHNSDHVKCLILVGGCYYVVLNTITESWFLLLSYRIDVIQILSDFIKKQSTTVAVLNVLCVIILDYCSESYCSEMARLRSVIVQKQL